MRETGNRNYFSQTDLSSAYPALKEKQNTICPPPFLQLQKSAQQKQAFIRRLFLLSVFRRKGGEKSVEETTSEWEKRERRQRDKKRRSRKGHLKEGSKQKRVSLTCGMGFNKIFHKKSTNLLSIRGNIEKRTALRYVRKSFLNPEASCYANAIFLLSPSLFPPPCVVPTPPSPKKKISRTPLSPTLHGIF